MTVSSILESSRKLPSTGQHAAHPYEQLPDSHESFSSDAFRINFMKILPCSKRYCHDWTICPFCHHGEKARRRDPKVMPYTGIACPDMKKDGACVRGELCPYAHNVFEYWLHPTRYRTQLCNDGTQCRRRVCFFAHTASQLRVPDSKPFVNPQALAAATAAAAARRTSLVNDADHGRAQDDVVGPHLRSGSDVAGSGQSNAMRGVAPANEYSNTQIVELLAALLRQKEGKEVTNMAPPPLEASQCNNEQLAALNGYMGIGLSLPQALAEVAAASGGKTGGKGYIGTPRSSLDLSGLQGRSSSDYTNSCRSSFETQQSQDRRISQDSLRTDSLGASLRSTSIPHQGLSPEGYVQCVPQPFRPAALPSGPFQEPPYGPPRDRMLSDGEGVGPGSNPGFGLNRPSWLLNGEGQQMTNDAPVRRASFDVAPTPHVHLAGSDRFHHEGRGIIGDHVLSQHPVPLSPGGPTTWDYSADLRSKSLPSGLSKNRLAGTDFESRFQRRHLPSVTEGVPYKAAPGVDYVSPTPGGLLPSSTCQDDHVVAPAPTWQSPFSQAVYGGRPAGHDHARSSPGSLFAKPPLVSDGYQTGAAPSDLAPQVPETEEVLRGIASL